MRSQQHVSFLTVGLFLGCGGPEIPIAPVEAPIENQTAEQTSSGSVGAGVSEQEVAPVEPAPPPPREDPVPPRATSFALSASTTCFLNSHGAVYCWGSNRFGELGDASVPTGAGRARESRARRSEPTEVPLPLPARRIVAGSFHFCALLDDGQIACWGHGGYGQLGRDVMDDVVTPARVPSLRAVELAAGGEHTCARSPFGEVRCWGRNDQGQLGVAPGALANQPIAVPGRVVQLASGNAHVCARLEDRAVYCWGQNVDAQLGVPVTQTPEGFARLPVRAESFDGDKLIAGFGITCAQIADGSWTCGGRNDSAQLDHSGGRPESVLSPPETVAWLNGAHEVAFGSRHTCARFEDGVRCVGLNHRGQLGDGTGRTSRRPRPVHLARPVRGVSFQGLAAGTHHACMFAEESLLCWGDNRSHQIGTIRGRSHRSPRQVSLPDTD